MQAKRVKRLYFPTMELEKIRILGDPRGGKAIKKVFLHKTWAMGKYTTTYCLKQNLGQPCPMCEYEELAKNNAFIKGEELKAGMKTQLNGEAYKEYMKPFYELNDLAWYYSAKPSYVMEIVRRKHDQNGRWVPGSFDGYKQVMALSSNTKKTGVYDKLIRAAHNYGDITHASGGRDILVQSIRSKKGYWNISNFSIDKEASPLFTQPIDYNRLNGDLFSWKEYYKPKSLKGINPYEYLLIIREGKQPVWDEQKRMYTIPNDGSVDYSDEAKQFFKDWGVDLVGVDDYLDMNQVDEDF